MITIPTLQQLQSDIQGDLESKFGDTLPSSGKNALRVLSAVQAGMLWLFYKAIAILQKNIFVDTADPESVGGTLERFGRVKLGRNPFPAKAGKYLVTVTGQTGSVIEAGTLYKSDDNSSNPEKIFILDTEYQLPSTTGTILIRALEAGLESALIVGDGLTATIPIAGVARGAVVSSEQTAPLAAETTEDYRAKIINSFRTEANGGAASDYRIWGFDAQGVRNIYALAKSGAPGEINVYVEATEVDSTDGKGTPGAGILAEVASVIEFDPDITKAIEDRGRRPLQAVVHVLPITVKPVTITITGYSGLTADIQTLITDGLRDMVEAVRPFISGADAIQDKNDILDLNKIIATIIQIKPGSIFTSVSLTVGGSPVTTNTFINGDIPYLNSVSFV